MSFIFICILIDSNARRVVDELTLVSHSGERAQVICSMTCTAIFECCLFYIAATQE